MKILYFQAHPVYGATENYVYTLAQRLNKADFQVGILYPDVEVYCQLLQNSWKRTGQLEVNI
ncbi:MAG: hypothetical protein ACFCUV_14410 [Rivularia sp. (in: cyanobacteria)]